MTVSYSPPWQEWPEKPSTMVGYASIVWDIGGRKVYMSTGGFIYAIGAVGTSYVKIGSTRTSVDVRLKQLQTGQPFPLQVLAMFPVEAHLSTIEKHIHPFLTAERKRGEWLDTPMDIARLETLVVRAIAYIAEASTPLPKTPSCSQPGPIGERITRLRMRRDMSQSDLAKTSGVPLSVINMIEAGVRSGENLRVETARKIANALTVTMDYLCGVHEEEDSEQLATGVVLVGA